MSDNLNLAYHVKRAIVKAIKITNTNLEAAKKLGVSERTFYNLLREHDLKNVRRASKVGSK